MLTLTKLAETRSTLTLGWTPPASVECYAFFANGIKASTADDLNKDGSPRSSVKFSKRVPGPPFDVIALVRSGGSYSIEWGTYPSSTPPPPPSGDSFPSTTLYPSEVQP